MTDLLPPTLDEMIEAVERELERRKRYYPARIKTGRLKAKVADTEMRRMQAVLDTLRQMAGNPIDKHNRRA